MIMFAQGGMGCYNGSQETFSVICPGKVFEDGVNLGSLQENAEGKESSEEERSSDDIPTSDRSTSDELDKKDLKKVSPDPEDPYNVEPVVHTNPAFDGEVNPTDVEITPGTKISFLNKVKGFKVLKGHAA